MPHCRWVHTVGMRFPIDVAFVSADGEVLKIVTMKPHRVGAPVRDATCVIEAEAGAFQRWPLVVGDVVEVRDSEPIDGLPVRASERT